MNADSDPPLEAAPTMQSSSTTGTTTQEQHLRAQLELLKRDPEAESSSAPSDSRLRDARNHQSFPSPASLSNGYDHQPPAPNDPRALAPKTDAESYIHPDLRGASDQSPPVNMMPIAPPSGHSPGASGPANTALAPAPPHLSGEEDVPGGPRKKRELAQSKRAAQNRAAQRAFRQRKETYIKQLEQEVRDFRELEKNHRHLMQDNYVLREYVLTLQSKLLDTQGEFPAPPPNLNLSQPNTTPPPPPSNHELPPSGLTSGTPLEAVAQAVAGLAAQEQMNDRHQSYGQQPLGNEQGTQDTRTAEEINRQLQSSEDPKPSGL